MTSRGKKARTEVRNIEFISKEPSQFFVFTFWSLQFKYSVHPCVLCCLPPHPFAYFLTSGFFLQTLANSNFFRFPLKVRVIGSRLYHVFPHPRNYWEIGYERSEQKVLGSFGWTSVTYNWLMVTNGYLEYHPPMISNACPPKRSLKACTHSPYRLWSGESNHQVSGIKRFKLLSKDV